MFVNVISFYALRVCLKCRSSGDTSNLKDHLNIFHRQSLPSSDDCVEQTTVNSAPTKKLKGNQATLRHYMSKLLENTYQEKPFKIVNDYGFKKIFGKLN